MIPEHAKSQTSPAGCWFPRSHGTAGNISTCEGFAQIKDVASDLIIDLIHNLKALKETDFDHCYSQGILAQYNGAPVRVIDLKSLYRENLLQEYQRMQTTSPL